VPGRSPHDREILRLAAPALGALAAGPLYVLVDTAIVGHLGTPELGALALAGTLITLWPPRRSGRGSSPPSDLRALWAALLVLMAARLATTGAWFAGRRWAVTGAPAPAPR
jgi:hypothetical protein